MVYGAGEVQGGTMDLLLDVYQSGETCTTPRPFVIMIHGGGFTGGSKAGSTWQENGRRVSERGMVGLSISYRLQGDNPVVSSEYQPFLDALIAEFSPLAGPGDLDRLPAVVAAAEDTDTAINWARTNAAELCADPDRFVIWGSSAGANTAHNVAYTVDDFGIDVPLPQAVINFWGGEMLPDPMKPGDPPIFILHGDRDATVAYSEALDKEDDAINNGVPYAFYTVLGAGHGWGNMQIDDTRVDGVTLRNLAVDFVAAHLFDDETPLYEVRSVPRGGSVTSGSANIDAAPVGRMDGNAVSALVPDGVMNQGAAGANASIEPSMAMFGGHALKVDLEAYAAGPHQSGIDWVTPTPIEAEADTVYLSYRVQFPEGFDFARGGVLPGFAGGIDTPHDWSLATGWSDEGRPTLIQRARGQGWHGAEITQLPDSPSLTAQFQPGRWHSVELAFEPNTPGQADGRVRASLDGVEMLVIEGVNLTGFSGLGAEALALSSFHLGDDITDAPKVSQLLRLIDVRWSTRPILAE